MGVYPDLLAFIFEGWGVGFFLAVALHYVSKFFFAPKGVFRDWAGPG